MCIIVSKAKGLDIPEEKILQRCFNTNSDGAGLMYVKDGKIQIEKGYMTYADFKNRLDELNKLYDLRGKSLVMHFRITTSGGTNPHNCHPFPISNSPIELKSTNIITEEVAVAHNGIINAYSYVKENDVLSDTQLFIQKCIYPIMQLQKDFYKNKSIMSMFGDIINNSRLCFLDKEENLYYVGDWISDNGIMYSNSGYKPTLSYYSSLYNFDNYEDEEEDYDYSYNYIKPKTEEEKKKLLESSEDYQKELDKLFEIIEEKYVVLDRDTGFIVNRNGSMAWVDVTSSYQYCVDKNKDIYYIDLINLKLIKEDTTYKNGVKSKIYRVGVDSNNEEILTTIDIDELFRQKELNMENNVIGL